ncbi:PIN domain-containing protein [Romeria aff. gracilis LEGE 07310]|uniref:PIN domain-containing protein n=1 Tax=Vasconcelosia minhoensis LEGE 07310 TaxID=915328 RepID=A0A8J7DSG0_9CYAN|nr:PIN domain-containing protein [Romeria aff. gracilis LEGE 07310]
MSKIGSYRRTVLWRKKIRKRTARIEEFISDNRVVNCDTDTARQYGEVKNRLRAKGRPLPENDIWIAALALQYGTTLVTRDAHFQQVAGLRTVPW